MISAWESVSSSLHLSPGGSFFMSLGNKHYLYSASLYTQVYKWISAKLILEVTLHLD